MGKELNQKEVDFVAIGIRVFLPAQVVKQQSAQSIVAADRRGLQELTQLMHLNVRVQFRKQLPGLLDRFLGGRIDAGFQIAVMWQIDHEFAGQRGIEGVKQAGFAPLGR
jgi:hypothetical protein